MFLLHAIVFLVSAIIHSLAALIGVAILASIMILLFMAWRAPTIDDDDDFSNTAGA